MGTKEETKNISFRLNGPLENKFANIISCGADVGITITRSDILRTLISLVAEDYKNGEI